MLLFAWNDQQKKEEKFHHHMKFINLVFFLNKFD